MDKREELLRAADSFDDVLVDADGLCRWTDVADALGIMRRKLADYTRAPAQSVPNPHDAAAWIDFADNGNIRFWTNYEERAATEKERGRHLRMFTLAELVQLAALRAPEAADAGAVAKPKRWLIEETLPGGCIRWQAFEHEFQARSEARPLGAVVTPLYASPTAAGIAAPPARNADDMSIRVALDFADNPRPFPSLAAPADTMDELREALRVLATAYRDLAVDGVVKAMRVTPPAASADAVREASTILNDLEAIYRLNGSKGLARLREIIAALTAPVAGADAGMRERAALELARQAIEYSIDMGGTDPGGVLLQALNKIDHALAHTSTDGDTGGQQS